MSGSRAFAVVVAAASSVVLRAQAPPLSDPMQCIAAWGEAADAALFGGGVGPEDIAYNAANNRVYVLHDVPNTTPDILLEYEIDGAFVAGYPVLPSIGGLCARPNGNLLLGYGLSLLEVTTTGVPVPGGVNGTLTIPTGTGFVGIQDCDEVNGQVYCHDGNNGTVVRYGISSGTTQVRFSNANLQSQALAVHPTTGQLWIAKPFFQPGPLSNGTIQVVTTTGVVVNTGNSAASGPLRKDDDPLCTPVGALVSLPNGFDFDASGDLWVSNFFSIGAPSSNIFRFRPQSRGAAIRIGQNACVGSNGIIPLHTLSGEPLFGTLFSVGVSGGLPNETGVWALGLGRDCGGAFTLGPGCAGLVDVNTLILPDLNTFFGVFPLSGAGDFSLSISLIGFTGAPFELYSQWLVTDPLLPATAALTNGYRLRFGP